jgi:hypothetical protein
VATSIRDRKRRRQGCVEVEGARLTRLSTQSELFKVEGRLCRAELVVRRRYVDQPCWRMLGNGAGCRSPADSRPA